MSRAKEIYRTMLFGEVIKMKEAKYRTGNSALILETQDNEPYATLTINIPEYALRPDEFVIKTYSENADIAEALFNKGIFVDTFMRVELQFVTVPIWRLLREELNKMHEYKVWYSKNLAETMLSGEKIDKYKLSATHTFLCTVRARHLDEVFEQMQGERWSPNGEARPLIESLGLRHTSFSVGDIIVDQKAEEVYRCSNIGWDLL